MSIKFSKRVVVPAAAVVITAGAIIGGAMAAGASTGNSTPAASSSVAKPGAVTPPGSTQDTICAKNSNNVPVRIYPNPAGCSAGYHEVRWYSGLDQITSFPASALNTPTVLHNVGGSIRTGVTDLGRVTLNKGTYDAKIMATFFRKVNTSSDPAFANIQTYGTLVMWQGPAILPDFSNDLTAGGILIPKVNSTTLTVDPTGQIDQTFQVANNNTEIHVGVFAYDDNSGSEGTTGQPGEGDFSAALQSATFELKNVA